MLSKSQAGYIKSLHQKKYRKEHGFFLAEGLKTVTEFIHSDYTVDTIFCTRAILPNLVNLSQKIKLNEISEAELAKISTLVNPQGVLALVRIPESGSIFPKNFRGQISIILDDIQDPGNLGTIIRTADWFGFKNIICSDGCVDAYNPKVVQATMGSLARVNITYTSLPGFLSSAIYPVYGALLHGTSVYDTVFEKEAFLILGNEGNGISTEVQKFITRAVTIPYFGKAESLNVAVSAAVICSEIKRKTLV